MEHEAAYGRSLLVLLKLLDQDWLLLKMSGELLVQQPIAKWNTVRGVWEKPIQNLLCEHWALFSETFPTWGTMRNGVVFELPMQVRHITGTGFSSSPIPDDSILRTPSVTDSTGGAISEVQARERGRMVKTADQVAQLAFENGLKVSDSIAESLLPTPAVGHIRNHDEPIDEYLARRQKMVDGEYRGMPGVSLGVAVRMEMLPTPNTVEHREIKTPEQIAALKLKSPGGYRNLRESVVNELLPTPVAQEGIKAPAQQTLETKSKTGQVWLSNAAKTISDANEVMLLKTPQVDDAKNTGHNQDRRPTLASEVWETERTTNWGKFEPAIRRWEQTIGREAPAPTNPDGKDGAHRLSSKFTEWMMGLPDGWITDCGLSRNDELKACGNGVVPQQAEMALRILLEGMELPDNMGNHLMPTPTVMDQRDGKHLRSVAIENLASGKNRGINLNNLVEVIGVDWQDGDTFEMTDEGLRKNEH